MGHSHYDPNAPDRRAWNAGKKVGTKRPLKPRQELASAPQIQPYPGMPASVMIVTEERTALDYILGPLTTSLHTAFRQK